MNTSFQMPPQASTIASQVDDLYYFIFWVSVFFFVLVTGLSLAFVLRYRRTAGRTRKPRAYHNTPLEVAWTVIPFALVMVVFIWGFKGYMAMSIAPGDSMDYYVTAKKWLWEIKHPNGTTAINEMTVPVGKPVKVILKSEDLIHSFFVPAFRVKQDAIPNRYQTLWFEATIPGEYDIFCAEFCGSGHSSMIGKVKVLTDSEWEAWQGKTGGKPEGMEDAEWGAQLYTQKACNTCHSIDGSVVTGPSFLELFGTQEQLADGSSVLVDEEYIRKSIVDPTADVTAGFQPVMPTYAGTLSDLEIETLIEFIKSKQDTSEAIGNGQTEN